MSEIQATIEEAFERRADVTPRSVETHVKEATQEAIRLLDSGELRVAEKNILPCIGCNSCMKTGQCVIQTDDMFTEIYPLLQKADIIVAATPVFFYGPSAQLKALIDRTQTLWSRKYALKLDDPRAQTRKGFLLSVGATAGQQLFDGIKLIVKYFFDAAGASYSGDLTFRKVDHAGDLKKLPGHQAKIAESVRELLQPSG
jgi:multimeric flavodoxin WrbA